MTLDPRPGPAWQRFTFGPWQITAIAVGTTTVDLTQVVLPTTTQEIARQQPDAAIVNPVIISINAYVLDDGTRCMLIDTGAGDLMGRTAGQLLVSLEQAGYQPAQIEAVLLTHIP